MSELILEDTVILWDCSRSMVRADFKPSRLRAVQKAIKIFISHKLEIDPKDSISIVIFGNRTKKIADFSSDPEYLLRQIKRFEFLGDSNLEDGIAFAIQQLIKQIRKIGGKTRRIFIITDNSSQIASKRIEKLVEISKGLKIFIDICQIGMPKHPKQKNTLKSITEATNGEYAYFVNMHALFQGAAGFASKKNVDETEDYFDPERENKALVPLLSNIAVELRRPTINEIHDMMHGKVDYKCQICYQNTCPICKNPFYGCGRFCPSCGRPIHLHCAALWAEQSKNETLESNIFRCPFCFFLLKVPKSVQAFMHNHSVSSVQIIDESNTIGQPVKMVLILDSEIDKIDDVCSYCNNIFIEGEGKVYKCSGCGSYYHEKCLQEMYEKTGVCRVCGGKIN
ncbi:MAG: VWA domain-containing protein [Promethearchaeota archaeon]